MTGTEQSPTGRANSSSASQEISSILCSPQVRYRVHNSPPPVHTLSPQQFNIIPCTSRSPKWSHSIRFLHQNPAHICVSYMPRVPPIHPTRFDHPNIILFREEYKPWSSSLCSFLQCSVTSALSGPNTFLSTLLSTSLSLCCFLDVRDKFHTHTKQQAKLQWWVPPSLDRFMALIISQ